MNALTPGDYMFRVFDIVFSSLGLIFLSPVMLIVFLAGYFDTRSPLFFQERLGRNKSIFVLVKFRTMHVDTESVASHLADASSVTRLGGFLRRTKLDELPQLWNVLKGEMSLVGPRPGLPGQTDLIVEREARGVYAVRPGITGLSQINDIDMSNPEVLAESDQAMIQSFTIKDYFFYIFATLLGRGSGDRVKR